VPEKALGAVLQNNQNSPRQHIIGQARNELHQINLVQAVGFIAIQD
jgi:hypothetical protein